MPGDTLLVWDDALARVSRFDPTGNLVDMRTVDRGTIAKAVEPREGLIRPDWFGEATAVIREWPEDAFAEIGVDSYLAVVAVAHEAHFNI